MCVRFYETYSEAREAGIKLELPPLMRAFWSDGALYFLVCVISLLLKYPNMLTCQISNFRMFCAHRPEG